MSESGTRQEEKWDLEIRPTSSIWDINFKEIWRYRDLLFLFVKRDITTVYKQTVLGPVWFFIQPILTSLTFMLVFGKIANLSTNGAPKALFYLSGVIIWSYFSTCVTATSNTFLANAGIFGKVYFPRLINPFAIIISNILKLAIQLIPFFLLWIYYLWNNQVSFNSYILLFPVLVIQTALLSLGLGLVVSSLTTKYRDFIFLINFGLQLLMYASCIIYPLSKAPKQYQIFLELNPMTWVIETFRYGFMHAGVISITGIIYSGVISVVALMTGIVFFNRVERNFMDTV